MEVVINRNGDVVSSKRGSFYAGSKNSRVIKLLADDNVFELIPKQSRIVHINIVRPDNEQTGWVLMETREDGIYYYLLEDWELSVPGEIKICFEIVNTESSAKFTTEEVFAIVKNGVIAQPVCKEDHTKLEGYYQKLNELAQKEYDVKVIDTYEIDFSIDGQKTAGLYKNYEHDVIDSVLSETEEKIYDTVVGVLQVSRVKLTDDEEQKYVSQTETLFANGRAWVRELKFDETGLIGDISEFQPLGYGAVGPRGYTGAEGPQGEPGKKGEKGSVWYSGQGQPSQSLGMQDDLYLRTDGEFNGFVYKKIVLEEGTEAIWKLIESIRGPQGERGERGLQGIPGVQGVQGVQGPIGPQGKDGKDGTSFDIWGKFTTLEQLKEAKPIGVVGEAYSVGIVEPYKIYTWDVNIEDWIDIGSIQGPRGEQGKIGPEGPQGKIGLTGEQGEIGPEGPQGKQGRSFNIRGEWNIECVYEITDLVIDVFTYQGVLYFTKQTAPQGTLPTNTVFFGVMLQLTLLDSIGENPNGAMSQEATSKELNKKIEYAEIKTLGSYSWAEIRKISVSGCASSVFKLGDIKSFECSDGRKFNARIVGFNHDDKNLGKAGISFMAISSYSEQPMHSQANDMSGYFESSLREYLSNGILPSLPIDMQNALCNVSKIACGPPFNSGEKTIYSKLWIPSVAEIFSTIGMNESGISRLRTWYNYKKEGRQYEYFRKVLGDIKPENANSLLSLGTNWWLRSRAVTDDNTQKFEFINTNGTLNSDGGIMTAPRGVVFGFCI